MIAEHATAVQVERTVRAYRGVLTAEEENEVANVRHTARYLRYEWNDDGSLQGHFRIPPEMAAILLAAVKTARQQVPADPDQDTPENCPAEHKREFATTNCDALVMMAESFLANGPAARSGSDRYQIVVNTDATCSPVPARAQDALRPAPSGVCELDDGPALASETLRRLACDASIVTITKDADGRVTGISSKAPAIPASTRRAVRRRRPRLSLARLRRPHLRQCAPHPPPCAPRRQLAEQPGGALLASPPPRARGRLERSSRTRRHHRGDPPRRPRAPVSPAGAASAPTRHRSREPRALGIAIDPATCIPRWQGEHLDLDHIVTGLLCLDRPGYASSPN